MTIGEKIRLARTEAGLSQRQLCGDKVTRNMLSLIENGAARPSMDTLSYFAAQLGKPVSFFLDEDTVTSPNTEIMAAARTAFATKDYAAVIAALADFHHPDPIFDAERGMLENISYIALADQATDRRQLRLAAQMLDKVNQENIYFSAIAREFWLVARFTPPADDRELILRAEEALANRDAKRALCYLQATEDHTTAMWQFYCGMAYFTLKDYENAIAYLQKAENEYPKHCYEFLETCFRELSDFESAYRYACKLREL